MNIVMWYTFMHSVHTACSYPMHVWVNRVKQSVPSVCQSVIERVSLHSFDKLKRFYFVRFLIASLTGEQNRGVLGMRQWNHSNGTGHAHSTAWDCLSHIQMIK